MTVEIDSFEGLNLIEPLLRALSDEKYDRPTQIQVKTIPHILEGRDIIGCAKTGTGKTAAFALPIMQLLARARRNLKKGSARVLVLTPTRELAAQIAESFSTYGRYMHQSRAVVFGGVGKAPQVRDMSRGIDVLVATPGRLLDLMSQGHIRLDEVEIFVLDEADRMLDMGFIHDIKRVIAALPQNRQTLFFSATMSDEIVSLAKSILTNPVRFSVSGESPTVDVIDQRVLFVDRDKKKQLLTKIIFEHGGGRTLVFTRTKHTADKVTQHLCNADIPAQSIHGNKKQNARTHALKSFRSGRTQVLVATDIAARGIDVDDITHVINYEIPDEPESYVHRIGRTARAGAEGTAISLCEAQERDCLRNIEHYIRKHIKVVKDHQYHSKRAESAMGKNARRPPKGMQKPRQKGRKPRKPSTDKKTYSGMKNRRH